MKLLIIFSSMDEAKYFISWLCTGKPFESELTKLHFEIPYYHYSYEIEGIFIDAVIVGQSHFETTFHTSRILNTKKFHLALQFGTAISNEDKIPFSHLCSVINDKPIDIGVFEDNKWKNAYDSSILQIDQYPHQMGGFVNKTNAYFNVFLDLKKVAGASVNSLYYDDLSKQNQYKNDFSCHIHYLNGIGFSYSCLYTKQPFYQIRCIINNPITNTIHSNEALEIGTSSLIEIIKKIS